MYKAGLRGYYESIKEQGLPGVIGGALREKPFLVLFYITARDFV